MTDFVSQPAPATSTPSSVVTILSSILSGLESGILAFVTSVIAIFLPKLIVLTTQDLTVIGNNFRLFLKAIGGGTPWGQALSDMLTGDWNETSADAKAVAGDFAEAVATVLETADLLPQGK